jgi:hypothetical protein
MAGVSAKDLAKETAGVNADSFLSNGARYRLSRSRDLGSPQDDVPADHCELWPQGAKRVDGNADRIAAVGRHIGQPSGLEGAQSIALADQTRRIGGAKAKGRRDVELSIPISREAFPGIIR